MAVAALSKSAVKITKIRHKRSKPGLQAQHLEGVRLVNALCAGKLQNDKIGCTEVTFTPGQQPLGRPRYLADCQTAGSITLLIQISLPVLLLGTSTTTSDEVVVEYKGGTNVTFSPPLDHTMHVLLPLLARMGLSCSLGLLRRGYYPRGGGAASLSIPTSAAADSSIISPLILMDQGTITAVRGVVFGNGDRASEVKHELRRRLLVQMGTHLLSLLPTGVSLNVEVADEGETTASSSSSSRDGTGVSVGQKRGRPDDGGGCGGGGGRQLNNVGAMLWLTTDTGCILTSNVLLQYAVKGEGSGTVIRGGEGDFVDAEHTKPPQLSSSSTRATGTTDKYKPDARLSQSLEQAASVVVDDVSWLVSTGCCVDEHTADQVSR